MTSCLIYKDESAAPDKTTVDFANKLEIALRECYETDYWLEVIIKVGSMDEHTCKTLAHKYDAIHRKLIASVTTAKDNADGEN